LSKAQKPNSSVKLAKYRFYFQILVSVSGAWDE